MLNIYNYDFCFEHATTWSKYKQNLSIQNTETTRCITLSLKWKAMSVMGRGHWKWYATSSPPNTRVPSVSKRMSFSVSLAPTWVCVCGLQAIVLGKGRVFHRETIFSSNLLMIRLPYTYFQDAHLQPHGWFFIQSCNCSMSSLITKFSVLGSIRYQCVCGGCYINKDNCVLLFAKVGLVRFPHSDCSRAVAELLLGLACTVFALRHI